jgi:hypothetical protein
MIRFYDLAGARDDCRFSSNCWPVRMALLHKGLPFEAIPWRFTEKRTQAATSHLKSLRPHTVAAMAQEMP